MTVYTVKQNGLTRAGPQKCASVNVVNNNKAAMADRQIEMYPFSLVHRATVSGVTVVGEPKVGKTSLILSYLKTPFQDQTLRSTIGVEHKALQKIELPFSGERINFHIFDAGGHEHYRNVVLSYMKHARVFLIVFDLCDKNTLTLAVTYWVSMIKENSKYPLEECIIYLVGTKSDLEGEREVSNERAQIYADQLGMRYYEASACSGHNIDNVFEQLFEDIDTIKTTK